MSRPTKYNKEMNELVKEYASQGYLQDQIATKLGISEAAFYVYLEKHLEFKEALKEGRNIYHEAFTNELPPLLFKSAKGYYVDETTTTTTKDKDGKVTEQSKVTKRYISPSTAMQIFLSKNHLPDRYSDKPQEHFNKGIKETDIKVKNPFKKED